MDWYLACGDLLGAHVLGAWFPDFVGFKVNVKSKVKGEVAGYPIEAFGYDVKSKGKGSKSKSLDSCLRRNDVKGRVKRKVTGLLNTSMYLTLWAMQGWAMQGTFKFDPVDIRHKHSGITGEN